MRADYSPAPGTTAYRVIAHMETLPAGAEVMTSALAEAIGVPANNLTPCLEAAVNTGKLFRRQRDNHVRSPYWWSLLRLLSVPPPRISHPRAGPATGFEGRGREARRYRPRCPGHCEPGRRPYGRWATRRRGPRWRRLPLRAVVQRHAADRAQHCWWRCGLHPAEPRRGAPAGGVSRGSAGCGAWGARMKPAHLNRQPDIDTLRRQKKRLPSEPPAPARPPGFYTELMRHWNWPPRFESRMPEVVGPDRSAISRENRERRVALGDSGRIV